MDRFRIVGLANSGEYGTRFSHEQNGQYGKPNEWIDAPSLQLGGTFKTTQKQFAASAALSGSGSSHVGMYQSPHSAY